MTSPATESSTSYSNNPILVAERSSMTAPNSADLILLSKLDEKNRFIESKKIGSNDPTYYLALDQISIANSNALEMSVKKIIDLANNGKGRIAYLYPLLVSHAGKPAFQIFLFHPPKDKSGARDASPLRRAAMEKSEPLIRSLLEAKRSKPTDIDEEDPGAALIKLDPKGARFYPDFFSLEYDFRRLLKKSYDALQIPYIEIPDFFDDLRQYFAKNKDLVDKIGDRYHIVIDKLELDEQGNYIRTPEIIRHYRVLADALEKFALNVLYDKAKKAQIGTYVSALDSYRNSHVMAAEPGRKQNREKVDALISLIEAYPYDRINDKENAALRDKLNDTLSWLKVIIAKKDNLVNRKQEQGTENLLNKVETLIQSHSKQNLDLFQIDLKKEILRTVKDEQQRVTIENNFEKRLTTRYGAYKVDTSENMNVYYFVDQKYMSAVLENLSRMMKTNKDAGERYEIAMKIYDALLKKKDPALDSALSAEERVNLSQMRVHNVNEQSAQKKSEHKGDRYNIPQGILVTLLSSILFLGAMLYSTQLFWLAFPLTLFSVIAFYRFNFSAKKSVASKDFSDPHESETTESHEILANMPMHHTPAAKQKIAAHGSAMVFPFSSKKYSEKVLTEEEFRAKVKLAAPEIKKSVTELAGLDGKNLYEAAYEILREDAVCIVIPTDIVKKSMGKIPEAVYINYKDFASDQVRAKIAEEYRTIFKPNLKEFEQEFYRYLINVLEIKYYTYLKKNLKQK